MLYFSRFCSDFSHFGHFSSNFVRQKIRKLQHVRRIGIIFRGHSSKNRTKSRFFARQGKPDPTLPYPSLPYPTLPYPTRPYPTLPYPTLPYPTLPYPTLPYPTLPYPTLPYPTLPYPTLPYPTLPYPSLPYPTLAKWAIQLFKQLNADFLYVWYGPRQQIVVRGQPTIAIRETPLTRDIIGPSWFHLISNKTSWF